MAPKRGNRFDFLEWLGSDMSTSIFMCLDDPTDVVRVTSVSRGWRRFVIAKRLCMKFCIRMCPEISNFIAIIEARNSTESVEAESSHSTEWESLERDHRVYTHLMWHLVCPLTRRDCIGESIGASSTDNYPDESAKNTLKPSDQMDRRPSYWSSKGESDPEVPETLTYRLCSKVCVVKEIKVQPFQAFSEYGYPIYSSKAVRFRMGYCRPPKEMERNMADKSVAGHQSASYDYVWTYVSPVFPMVQENVLQSFKLPRPAICIGQILQIELLGRVQKKAIDDLYYICVCHVQVIGRPLSPVMDADIFNIVGNSVLMHCPDPWDRIREPTIWLLIGERARQLQARMGWDDV